jgi:hypothetical protein
VAAWKVERLGEIDRNKLTKPKAPPEGENPAPPAGGGWQQSGDMEMALLKAGNKMDGEHRKRTRTAAQSVGEPTPTPGGRRLTIDLKSLDPRTGFAAKLAATLTDKLRQTNGISLLSPEEWRAACILRDLHHAVHDRPSEGVGNYDLHQHDGDGAMAASRRAERLMVRNTRGGDLHRRYNDAVFAMVGLVDERGYRVIPPRHLNLMWRAILDSETSIRQDEVGQAVSNYKPGPTNKQVGAAGAMFVKHCLVRLAAHFGLTKGEEPPR